MKIDITISKKFTLNTGNYSSIQPSVSLSVKDTELEKIETVHAALDVIASGLLLKQIMEDSEIMDDFKNFGISAFFKKIDMKDIDAQIKENLKRIE
jgi:hypothetical protein